MIGMLPTSLEVNATQYQIRSDYRVALLIFEAFEDPGLSEFEKALAMVRCLYAEPDTLPEEDFELACEKASWFLDGGRIAQQSKTHSEKVLSWTQDESIIFPAINKVAGQEIRLAAYVHWWTFLGYFSETGEGMLSTVLSIRQKKADGKSLDKWEKDFYKRNRTLVDIEKQYSKEEREQRDKINAMIGGG